jgi:nucleotide-binding universal stress UspA family protein
MVDPQERRIVVGVDGSKSSARALSWAVQQAELTGAVLEVVTTWEWPTSYGWGLVIPEGWSPTDDAQKVLDEALGSLAEAHPGVTIRPVIIEGHPAPVLVHESEGADLLVVGSRGHGEFAGMLLGSVSEHCVTNAHCPVLVLRDGE